MPRGGHGGRGIRPAASAGVVVLAVSVVLAAGGTLTGCGGDTPTRRGPVPTPSATRTGPRVAAGTFPTVPGYTWSTVGDDEWAKVWPSLSSSYAGFLADGQARYATDRAGHPVAIVMVAWPAPGKAGATAMAAALDRQSKRAAQQYGTAGVKEVAGHDVLEFTDGTRQPNWYWVSGDEIVMVTGPSYESGTAFVAALSAATR